MQKISTALLLCRPGSHLPFLLADQDLATLASAGVVEGRGDLGWLRLGWGSQGFPRQGKGSRRCARGGMQPKPRGVTLLPLNPAAGRPRAGQCCGAGPRHRPLSAQTSAIGVARQGQDCGQGEGRARQAEGSQDGSLLVQSPFASACLGAGSTRAQPERLPAR